MITATFHAWRGGTPLCIGPRPYFRVEGAQLYSGDEHTAIAVYEGGTWDINRHGSFVRFLFDRPVCVALEAHDGDSHCLGSIPQLVAIDGAMYAGPHMTLLMLRFSELSNQWYCYENERHYDRLRFECRECP